MTNNDLYLTNGYGSIQYLDYPEKSYDKLGEEDTRYGNSWEIIDQDER